MHPHPAASRCAVHRLGLVEYQEAWALQRRLAEACRERGELHLLLLEHPPTYTLGARGKQEHLLLSEAALARLGASVHCVDRGGDITFHGPGQLVGYPILDLRRWNQGPLWYVRSLEAVLIDALASFGIDAARMPGRPGVWAGRAKIASIGVHISRGITSHGFALNVDPDLTFFSHIVPCGLPDVSMTSMAEALQHRATNCAASAAHMPPPSVGDIQMPAVIDTVVEAFARAFELEMEDLGRRGDHLVALGGQPPAPTPVLG
jgi:lipoyl(octanoyl) transferase